MDILSLKGQEHASERRKLVYLKERIIIGAVVAISLGSLLFVKRQKVRDAVFIFLFTQIPSWILGLLVVEIGCIQYPVRDFYKANATSFTYEFLVLPITTIFFILNYPNKKHWWFQGLYALTFCSVFTALEAVTVKYTRLIHYNKWSWYWTLLSLLAFYYFIYFIYVWYFKTLKKKEAGA